MRPDNPSVDERALQLSATPEAEQLRALRAELAILEQELGEQELRMATYVAELEAFEARYRQALDAGYARLDDLTARIAEARASRHPTDAEAQAEADRARAQANESARAGAQSASIGAARPRFIPSASAKRLFRRLARCIHPDLAVDPEERERRTELMALANAAYERGDTDKLNRLLVEWEASPESVVGEGMEADIERAVRKIVQAKARLEAITSEIARLEASFLLVLYRQVKKADEEGRDLLAGMAEELERQIAKATDELRAMVGEEEEAAV